jgi:hypothetical protein
MCATGAQPLSNGSNSASWGRRQRDGEPAVAKGSIIEYHGVRVGLVYRIKYRDASGRQVQETVGAAAEGVTRKHAERELRDRLTDVERDGFRKPKRVKFSDSPLAACVNTASGRC